MKKNITKNGYWLEGETPEEEEVLRILKSHPDLVRVDVYDNEILYSLKVVVLKSDLKDAQSKYR